MTASGRPTPSALPAATRQAGSSAPTARSAPRWSVIVPTCRRPDALRRVVASLRAAAPPPGGVEVVVVDDGDENRCAPIWSALREGGGLRVFHLPNLGPACARNHGARHARGSELAFVDDDCVVDPDWLLHLDRARLRHPQALLAGRTCDADDANRYSRVSQAVAEFASRWSVAHDRLAFAPSCNLAVPARAFAAIGGFDRRFGRVASEDRDFCERWSEAGGTLVALGDAIVRHHHRMGLGGFVGQHVGYGRGARHLVRRRAERGGTAHHPALFGRAFYTALLRCADHVGPRRSTARALVALAQLAYAAGYLSVREERD